MKQNSVDFLARCTTPQTAFIFDADNTTIDTEQVRLIEAQIIQQLTAQEGSRELWSKVYEEVRRDIGFISYRDIAIRFAQALTQTGTKTLPEEILNAFSQLPFGDCVSHITIAFIRELKRLNTHARFIFLSEGDNTVQMMKVRTSGLLSLFDTQAHYIGADHKIVETDNFESLLSTGHNAFITPFKEQIILSTIQILLKQGITNFVVFDDKVTVHIKFAEYIQNQNKEASIFHVRFRYGKYNAMELPVEFKKRSQLLELFSKDSADPLGSIYRDLGKLLSSKSPEVR